MMYFLFPLLLAVLQHCYFLAVIFILPQISGTLDKALRIYRGSPGSRRAFCVCCPNDSEDDAYTCLTCEDR